MTDAPPIPPRGLPNYVVDPLDRQSPERLDQLLEYIEELRDYKFKQREKQIEDVDLEANPDVEDVVETGDGFIVTKWQKCGADCECNDGKGHGPYKWHVKYVDGKQEWSWVKGQCD